MIPRLLSVLALSAATISGCGQSAQQPEVTQTTKSTGRADIGGPFSLVDQDGRAFTDRDLLGKPTLVFFGFTYCPEVCPTTLLHMSSWLKQLGSDADKLNAVYVTVDPERDTPKQIKQYLSAFDPRIRGLTGTPDQVASIVKGYKAYAKRVPLENGDYVMDHSTMVYMMDESGGFVGPIGYGEPDAQVIPLLRDLVAGRTSVKRAATPPNAAVERSGS